MFSKWPSKNQWRQVLKVLGNKEKKVFIGLALIAMASFLFLCFDFYFKATEKKPERYGTYAEGIVGGPRFINPVYSFASDVDRDLSELFFSGLMKYGPDGKTVNDLAKEYTISEDGKIYEFTLKDKLLWSDNKPLNADDVIFTVKTIQDPSYKSPIRASWLGVKAEKVSDSKIRFELKDASAVFLENCTLKIMPKHIWQDITFQNFPLSIYNLKPIGSGPYKLKSLVQDEENNVKSMELSPNQYYYGEGPFLNKISFYFFETENDLIKSAKSGKINGFSLNSLQEYAKLAKNKKFSIHRLSMPRYFALFFNPGYQGKSVKILSDDKIRQALNYATNKQEIIKSLLLGNGEVVDSPVLPDIYGLKNPEKKYEFNPEKAKQLIKDAGYSQKENGNWEKTIKRQPAFQFKSTLRLGSQGTEVTELQKCLANPAAGGVDVYPEGEISGYFGEKTKSAVIRFQEKYRADILEPNGLKQGNGEVKESTRAKLNQLCSAPAEETATLSFSLTTVEQPFLKEVANLIKKQWEAIGVKVEVKTYDISSLEEEVIKPRNYEILLFGEVLGAIPDPYPFWHSSQTNDPGLNLAGFSDKDGDKLLEAARQTMDEKERNASLEKFQNILIGDAPCVFLYNPDYVYFVSKKIKGVNDGIITDPAQRFDNIENWYIKTKRVWK